MNDSGHMYRVREAVPELDVRAGDYVELVEDRRKVYLIREVGTFDAPEVAQLAAFVFPLNDAPPADEVLGIRRPPARKRARAPRLTLVRGGAA